MALELRRTHKCGDLRIQDIGKSVTLLGKIGTKRIYFDKALGESIGILWIKDMSGGTRVIIRGTGLLDIARGIPIGSVMVGVTGVVEKRDHPNNMFSTGEIEIWATKIIRA